MTRISANARAVVNAASSNRRFTFSTAAKRASKSSILCPSPLSSCAISSESCCIPGGLPRLADQHAKRRKLLWRNRAAGAVFLAGCWRGDAGLPDRATQPPVLKIDSASRQRGVDGCPGCRLAPERAEQGRSDRRYLLCRRTVRPNRHKPGERFIVEYRDEPMGGYGLHDWWYSCLERAGVVAQGQTRGERMHNARHTAGQRVLDHTRGNLKATQKLLGTRRSRPPPPFTSTGTSISSRRPSKACWRADRESFPPTLYASA